MDIASTIRAAAQRYGLDPDVMVKIAQTESGLDPSAANPKSSARGLYQFIAPTWARYGGGRDPLDPMVNIDAGMRLTRDNVATLRNTLGRDPTPGEVYLAHQQGAGEALKMLKNPSAPVGGAAITLNGGRDGMTAGDFAARWTGKFDGSAPQPAASVPAMPASPQMMAQQPGFDLSPLADALQRVAEPAQQPRRYRKSAGGPLMLS